MSSVSLSKFDFSFYSYKLKELIDNKKYSKNIVLINQLIGDYEKFVINGKAIYFKDYENIYDYTKEGNLLSIFLDCTNELDMLIKDIIIENYFSCYASIRNIAENLIQMWFIALTTDNDMIFKDFNYYHINRSNIRKKGISRNEYLSELAKKYAAIPNIESILQDRYGWAISNISKKQKYIYKNKITLLSLVKYLSNECGKSEVNELYVKHFSSNSGSYLHGISDMKSFTYPFLNNNYNDKHEIIICNSAIYLLCTMELILLENL